MSNREQLRHDELTNQVVDFLRDATLNVRAAEVSMRELALINKSNSSGWVKLGMLVAARKSLETLMEMSR